MNKEQFLKLQAFIAQGGKLTDVQMKAYNAYIAGEKKKAEIDVLDVLDLDLGLDLSDESKSIWAQVNVKPVSAGNGLAIACFNAIMGTTYKSYEAIERAGEDLLQQVFEFTSRLSEMKVSITFQGLTDGVTADGTKGKTKKCKVLKASLSIWDEMGNEKSLNNPFRINNISYVDETLKNAVNGSETVDCTVEFKGYSINSSFGIYMSYVTLKNE